MPSANKPVAPADLYSLKQMYDCVLSPDGQRLITAMDAVNKDLNKKYMNLFMQRVSGGPLRQFTRGESVDSAPRFSPDGKLLAFVSARSGQSQLHLMHVDGGESWQLTKLAGNVGEFCWSPDSQSLCVVFTPQDAEAQQREQDGKCGKPGADAPKLRHITNFFYKLDGAGYLPQGKSELHLVNAATGKTAELVKDGFHNGQPCFTPDGRWIVFASNKHPDFEREMLRSDLWKVRADGQGKMVKIATHDGPASGPVVSPDGQWLAFTGHPDPAAMWNERNEELFVVPFKGGAPVNLSRRLDRPAGNVSINDTWGMAESRAPLFSPCGRYIYLQITKDGNTAIYRFGVADGSAVPVFEEPGVVLDFSIDFAGGWLYVALSDFATPGDLYKRKLDGGKLIRLTKVNQSWLGKRALGQVEEHWVKGAGGQRIHGWAMLPPGYDARKKYPAILYIHGGPHVAFARAFFHEFNYLAGAGYLVLFCNPRGSDGYGQDYCGCIAEGWGNKDYADLMKFTDAMLAAYPAIDQERVGVTGGSYGGYMTNWIIGHTHRFKAAVTQRSVSNFLSFMGSCDVGYMFHYEFKSKDKSPWQDRERFLQMSPMTHLIHAKTPTLVIHSENDLRCPIEQGEQVYVQLKLQGVDTELVRFPQESHGLSRGGRTDRRIERLERIKGWMDKHLLDGKRAAVKKAVARKK